MTMDLAAQQASLDVMYGPTSGDLTVELLHADGSETTGAGYAPGTVAAAGWEPTDAEGVKWATNAVDCGTPTDEWPQTITDFRLMAGAVSWGTFPLPPLDVGGPGSPVLVRPAVFFGDLEID